GDPRIDFACTATATGSAPPPTVRVAILWGEYGHGIGDGVHGAGVVVEEKGVAPTNGTNFNPPLETPPDAALVYAPPGTGPQFPEASAFGSYVLYEDLDGDEHLLRASPGHYSPDLIVAIARDAMIYSKGGPTPGFALEQVSPFPDPADCIGAPCELPFDSGSQLLGPGTKIELVAVGPITGELSRDYPRLFRSLLQLVQGLHHRLRVRVLGTGRAVPVVHDLVRRSRRRNETATRHV
ncbi:MAG: hypothetical protein ACRELY_29890, partial [Polyangiaceae bacterium]